jgi:nickel-dependent lactate racemase
MEYEDTPSVDTLMYGRGKLPIPGELAGARVVAPPDVAAVPDVAAELKAALGRPVGAPPLCEFVREGDLVTIVVSDITRPAATREMLPVILEEVSHAGEVRIVVALGLHRRLEKGELGSLLGEKAAGSLPVFQHDPRERSRLIFLGRTRCGTEVHLSRFLLPEHTYRSEVNADEGAPLKVVLTGTISPHYFYGFSGGRKSILPGCASEHSIRQNHSLVLGPGGERVRECRAGNLAGNLCHLDSLEAARMIPGVFMVNTVHAGAAGVVSVVAGGLEEAHLQGCRFYLDNCAVELHERFDVVVGSCGGYPMDLNFIQSHKAIEYAFGAVKPGGTLVLAAECAEGFGSEGFFKWFRHKELSGFYKALQEDYEVYGQTAYATLWKAKKIDIVLVSSLNPDDVREMSITPARDLAEAAQFVKAKHGGDFSACIMPYAADTLIKDETLKLE